MAHCNQSNCEQEGTSRYTWPGQNERVICDRHLSELKAAAKALEMHLEIRPVENVASRVPCGRCEGCGQIADSEDGEPWTTWAELPPGADLAVRMGLVKPIPCPVCST